MVVEARDIAAPVDGFAPDASEAIPEDELLEFPEGTDDAALSGDDESVEAATPTFQFATEDDFLTNARTRLEPEFAERLRKAQSTADRLRAQAERKLATAETRRQARESVLLQQVAQVFEQAGVDPTHLELITGRMDKAERAVDQQTQQQTQGFRGALETLGARHQEHLEAHRTLAPDGQTVIFDPASDPDIQRQFEAGLRLVEQHHLREGGQPGTPAAIAAERHFAQLQVLFERKKLAAEKAHEAAQKNARALANRQKNASRGPQATARGGGSAPPDFKAYLDQARQDLGEKASYADVYTRAVALNTST